jgi:hypothetical protein
MNKSSAIRVFQMLSLEEQRGPLMAGMQILMRAYTHLRDCPESTENSLAMQQILSIIGPMEDENKSLSEQSEDLWSAVLEQVGPELSSKEIEKAENNAATGADWAGGSPSTSHSTSIEGRDGIFGCRTLCVSLFCKGCGF